LDNMDHVECYADGTGQTAGTAENE
jgi:hypothetical protein